MKHVGVSGPEWGAWGLSTRSTTASNLYKWDGLNESGQICRICQTRGLKDYKISWIKYEKCQMKLNTNTHKAFDIGMKNNSWHERSKLIQLRRNLKVILESSVSSTLNKFYQCGAAINKTKMMSKCCQNTSLKIMIKILSFLVRFHIECWVLHWPPREGEIFKYQIQCREESEPCDRVQSYEETV